MRHLVVALLLLCGCDKHPECNNAEVEKALNCAVLVDPELADIADRMQVFCSDSTADTCLYEEDACTIAIGSEVYPGRTAVNNRVPVGNAIAHEAMHWKQMKMGNCTRHVAQCGWDKLYVEKVLSCIKRDWR